MQNAIQHAAQKALDHGRTSDGATPLMLACDIGDVEAVRYGRQTGGAVDVEAVRYGRQTGGAVDVEAVRYGRQTVETVELIGKEAAALSSFRSTE